MSVFDNEQFNGFARRSLDNLLFADLWNHDIFNESDMHSAAYYYIRRYFGVKGRGNVYVRCEPMLVGMKPDIVIYTGGKPTYVLEFKMFTKPDFINEKSVVEDLEKLSAVIESVPSVKWGFFHMIHDSDEPFNLSSYRLKKAGFNRISVTAMNARRKEDSGRRRVGYDEWRARFDRLVLSHKSHA